MEEDHLKTTFLLSVKLVVSLSNSAQRPQAFTLSLTSAQEDLMSSIFAAFTRASYKEEEMVSTKGHVSNPEIM